MKKTIALLLCAASGLVLAALVTAADIVAAIQNSPTASAWLKQNAQAVGQLAINVESGGNTTAFNGSCCYGVLQMNTRNIAKYAKVTPEQYRQLDLQQQVNAWAELTTDAMQSAAVRNLLALGTFEGRPVDGNLVLACVQLGIGNCQTMINAGKCSGFADSNGTTICAMADRIGGATSGGSNGGSSGNNPGGLGPGSGNGSGWHTGSDRPTAATIAEGFAQGSGIQMSALRRNLQMLGSSVVGLVLAACMAGLWRKYSTGHLSTADLKMRMLQAGVTLSIAVGMISWL
jgi:hypothetical protein